MNKGMLLSLYESLLSPHLEKASAPAFKKDATLVENVQRRATRMLRYLGNKRYTKRFKESDFPILKYRR